MLLGIELIKWKRMLCSAQPCVLVTHSPSQESSAHTWIVHEAGGQEVSINLSLLFIVPIARVVHFHIEFSDMDLETEITKLFNLFCNVLTRVGAVFVTHMGLNTDSIDLDLLQLHMLDHFDDLVSLEVV